MEVEQRPSFMSTDKNVLDFRNRKRVTPVLAKNIVTQFGFKNTTGVWHMTEKQ